MIYQVKHNTLFMLSDQKLAQYPGRYQNLKIKNMAHNVASDILMHNIKRRTFPLQLQLKYLKIKILLYMTLVKKTSMSKNMEEKKLLKIQKNDTYRYFLVEFF